MNLEKFSTLLQHALVQATSQQEVEITVIEEPEIKTARPIKEYTPKELSNYFGVSFVTIHNWLKQGRFEGVEPAGDNKHNHISEDTFYITAAGKKIRISDVVQMWEKQEGESVTPRNEDKLSYYTRQIAMYEEKYHGELNERLEQKMNCPLKKKPMFKFGGICWGDKSLSLGIPKSNFYFIENNFSDIILEIRNGANGLQSEACTVRNQRCRYLLC
ncbi:DNA-binding transcriptional regulator YiaG [Fontibacillus solani]|uniref:DNA-binding transcriptional regulator YiaG n=1 Tax=Fontibacillus solani TaxID=1572857 RepID=A0A7W3SQD7_9BACL|nr:hypothetical protein [Fontibacillus solani]MBA9084297.1 DNA-binding transcriptional regulator YiaG [Fontibacillus solani]